MAASNMIKNFFFLFFIIILAGCMDQEIYTEINEPKFISHPPESLRINDFEGNLNSDFKRDPNAPILLSVYIHNAHCTNAKSKSLGADFDGYIRITLTEKNTTIARAQMDFKGDPNKEKIQKVYSRLMKTLKWR